MVAATLDKLPPVLAEMHAPQARKSDDAWVMAAPKRLVAISCHAPRSRQLGMQAVTVISISSSGAFSAATVTVVRAGLLIGKYLAYSSL
jgi:hypothetical protein